jgi:ribosomal protein S27E
METLKNDEKMPDINTDAICPNCFGNDAVYNSIVADYRCQICGEWFMGEEVKP